MTSDNRIHKKVCETYKRLHLDYVYAYKELKCSLSLLAVPKESLGYTTLMGAPP